MGIYGGSDGEGSAALDGEYKYLKHHDIQSLYKLVDHMNEAADLIYSTRRGDDEMAKFQSAAQFVVALDESLTLLEHIVQACTSTSRETLGISKPSTLKDAMLLLEWAIHSLNAIETYWYVELSESDRKELSTRLKKAKKCLSKHDNDIRISLRSEKRSNKNTARAERQKNIKNRARMEREWEAKFGRKIEGDSKGEFETWWKSKAEAMSVHLPEFGKIESYTCVRNKRSPADVSVTSSEIEFNLKAKTVTTFSDGSSEKDEVSPFAYWGDSYSGGFENYFAKHMSSATRKVFLDNYLVHITIEPYTRTYTRRDPSRWRSSSYRESLYEEKNPTVIANQLAKLGPEFQKYVTNLEVKIYLPKLTELYNFASSPELLVDTSGYKVIDATFAEIKKYNALKRLTVLLDIPHRVHDVLADHQLVFILPLCSLDFSRWVLKYDSGGKGRMVSLKDRDRLIELHQQINNG